MTMARRGAVVLAIVTAAMAAGACVHSTPDGDACKANDDCDSGYCRPDGYCAGKPDCKSAADCDDGWDCVTYTSIGDDVANFFGGDASSSICMPTCGHCPADMHCDGDQTKGTCVDGSTLDVDIGGPREVVVGQPLTMTATAASSATIVSYTWTFDEGGDSTTMTGATVTHVFAAVGDPLVYVKVKDSTGHEVSGDTGVSVVQPAGGPCTSDRECLSTSSCQAGVCL